MEGGNLKELSALKYNINFCFITAIFFVTGFTFVNLYFFEEIKVFFGFLHDDLKIHFYFILFFYISFYIFSFSSLFFVPLYFMYKKQRNFSFLTISMLTKATLLFSSCFYLPYAQLKQSIYAYNHTLFLISISILFTNFVLFTFLYIKNKSLKSRYNLTEEIFKLS